MTLHQPPLSLYVHLPWCVRKCPYCDFNSYKRPDQLPDDEYVEALLLDLEQDLQWVWGRPVVSIYMGGGTPSLFSPEAISRLLDGIRALVTLRPGAEISMELNPGTLEHGPLPGYRDAGINRLSIGAQSFSRTALSALGRIHSVGDTLNAFQSARDAGFDNINLDLMFALPQQTLEEALDDVARACELEPEHLSLYHLTLESNTEFAHRPPALPDEDLAWQMLDACQHELAKRGLLQYEVSAYAKPDRQCLHNLNYWRFGDYLAIGAGAHGKLTQQADSSVWRYAKVAHPKRYLSIAGTPERLAKHDKVPMADLPFEFMLNASRLQQGFEISDFEARTGHAFDVTQPVWESVFDDRLMERDEQRIWPTDLGRRHSNEIMARFLPDTVHAA